MLARLEKMVKTGSRHRDMLDRRLHYEKLKAIREQLLHQTAAEGLLVEGRQVHQSAAVSDKVEAEQAITTAASSGLLLELLCVGALG